MAPVGHQPMVRSARRGLTLVEVLVALAVMMVFVLPVVIGLSQALSITSQSSTSVAASSLARARIEDLKAAGYANIPVGTQQSYEDLRTGDQYFEVKTVVSEDADPDDPTNIMKRKKLVEVSVYQKGSQSPLVVLTTYFVLAGV